MEPRKVQFGLINLKTNGIDQDVYDAFFHPQNRCSDIMDHPKNWSIGKIRELLETTGEATIETKVKSILNLEEQTRLTREDLERINPQAAKFQPEFDKKYQYTETQGIFKDFGNAYSYYKRLRHLGINGWSNRVHPDLFVKGEGDADLWSDGGIKYVITPEILVEGLSHTDAFHLEMRLPEEFRREATGLYDFIISHRWPEEFELKPEYMLVSRNGGPYVREVSTHVLSHKDLDVHGDVTYRNIFMGLGLFGRISNYEEFCKITANELDKHFHKVSKNVQKSA